MPIFCYECSCCHFEFEEYKCSHKNSGKTLCHRCGNVAFKVPAIFNANIFKPRKFGDGTTTPPFVSTPSQEKAWMKSEGITYDTPTAKKKIDRDKKFIKDGFYGTAIEHAFKKAVEKTEQGFKIENPKQRKPKKEVKLA